MSTFLTLHSKKALFTHGNLTAKATDSVELFKVDGSAKTVSITKDAATIFKQNDSSGGDLLKITPVNNQLTTQGEIDMKTLDGNSSLVSLNASNAAETAGLTTKTNVNLQSTAGDNLLILDADKTPDIDSLQAPYLKVTTQFKTSGETELDGAVNITGVTTVDNKLNVNGTLDINGGDLILDENSELIVAGGSELNVIGDEGIHWFNGGLEAGLAGGYNPVITIGGASVNDFSGDYVRKMGIAGVALPGGNGLNIEHGSNSNPYESSGGFYATNAQHLLNQTDYFFHKVHNNADSANTSEQITYSDTKGEYYWNQEKGAILFKENNDWLTTTETGEDFTSITTFYRANWKMNFRQTTQKGFRKNGQTQWVLLKNTAWAGEPDMPQFQYDTVNSIQRNGYFEPIAQLSDMDDDDAIKEQIEQGKIPFTTALNSLWDQGTYNYTTVVNDSSIRKFNLPHFSGNTLFDKVVDNDTVVWSDLYSTTTTDYDNKEYSVLITTPDITSPTYDSNGNLLHSPYDYYLTSTGTSNPYYGYFKKKYNLALTVEETGASSNVFTVKTDVNNDYRYYEAQLPFSNSSYHYRYIMSADNDFGQKFFDHLVGSSNSISGDTRGWFTFSTKEKLNSGISQDLGEFDFSGTYTFNDVTSGNLAGHPESQFQVNGKSVKFVPIDAYYTNSTTSSYDSNSNRDSTLIPYHEDHQEGQVIGFSNTQGIGWHSNDSGEQYGIGWGYPFTSNGGDVTLSNLNVRGELTAIGNSYIKELYAGTSTPNSAAPLLVTNTGASLTTTPLDYYKSFNDKENNNPFFTISPELLAVEVKDTAILDIKTSTQSDGNTSGALVVAGGAGIGKKLNVSGATSIDDTLGVTGATSLASTLGVTSATTLDSTLGVSGITTIGSTQQSDATNTGALVVAGGVGIGLKLNVGGSTTLSSALNVTGTTTLDSTLGVSGVTTIGNATESTSDTVGALVVAGGVGITKRLNVTGNTTLKGTLGVTSATTLDSTLGVTGATSLGSDLDVTGDTTLTGTLGVTGVTTISNDTDSTSDTVGALVVAGGVGITKRLNVTGNTTLKGTLGVTSATTLDSTLGVSSATTLASSLTVQTDALSVPTSGAITMARDLTLSSNKITCQNIEVKGTMTTINTEEVNIKDNHIVLNSTHTATDSEKDSGIVSVGKASTTIVCRIDGVKTLKEVTPGAVTGASFTAGDIILVTSKGSDDNSDKNNGLYSVHNIDGAAGTFTFKQSGLQHIDFCRTSDFDTTAAGNIQYDVSKVSVHHMYFDTDSTNGNTIKYGYGERESDFQGYGYLDLTQGDVRSSFEEATLATASHTLTKSITRVTSVTAPNKLILPSPSDTTSKLVDGTTYKVINSTGSSVTIDASGSDGGTDIKIELGDGVAPASDVELYPYSTITLTYANALWYVL